jgi:hypothetical protein
MYLPNMHLPFKEYGASFDWIYTMVSMFFFKIIELLDTCKEYGASFDWIYGPIVALFCNTWMFQYCHVFLLGAYDFVSPFADGPRNQYEEFARLSRMSTIDIDNIEQRSRLA